MNTTRESQQCPTCGHLIGKSYDLMGKEIVPTGSEVMFCVQCCEGLYFPQGKVKRVPTKTLMALILKRPQEMLNTFHKLIIVSDECERVKDRN